MPKQTLILVGMLKETIPYGKSCSGCRFLKNGMCLLVDAPIVDEVKVCRVNVEDE